MEEVNGTARDGSLLRRIFTLRPWSSSEIPLRRFAAISLAAALLRAVLELRFPALVHPVSPGAPLWAGWFMVVEGFLFAITTAAVGGNVIDAIRARRWRQLDTVGVALYLAWWAVVAL